MGNAIEEDGVLSKVWAGLPRVAGLIAMVPEERRERALEAAEQSYLKTARELGYEEEDALQWVSAVMVRLQGEISDQHEHAQSAT